MNLIEHLFREYRRQPGRQRLLRLLKACEGPVYNLCFQVLRHRHDAEDASQEVFIEILQATDRMRDATHFRRWLYRAGLNTALDFKRRRGRKAPQEAASSPGADPDAVRDALHEHIARLDGELRTLLVGYYFEKRTLEDIARENSVSSVAVWKRIGRARELLRQSLTRAGLAGVAPLAAPFLESVQAARPEGALIGKGVLAKAGLGVGRGAAPARKSFLHVAVPVVAAALFAGVVVLSLCDEPGEFAGGPGTVPPRKTAAVPEPPAMEPGGPAPVAEETEDPRERITAGLRALAEASRNGEREKMKALLEELRGLTRRPEVPDELNAALLYKEAVRLMNEIPEDEDMELLWYHFWSGERVLSWEEKQKVGDWLESHSEVFDLLRRAADLSHYRDDNAGTPGEEEHFQYVRGLVRAAKILDVLAKYRGEQAAPGAVSDALLSSLAMGRTLSRDRTPTTQLIGYVASGISEWSLRDAMDAASPELVSFARPMRT
ncbi:MAG: RNA polymerase sigma factor [Planctomycetota bacterium]|jgi:RNA polymerase sigma-70 factor (ECF subfamily)